VLASSDQKSLLKLRSKNTNILITQERFLFLCYVKVVVTIREAVKVTRDLNSAMSILDAVD